MLANSTIPPRPSPKNTEKRSKEIKKREKEKTEKSIKDVVETNFGTDYGKLFSIYNFERINLYFAGNKKILDDFIVSYLVLKIG